MEIEEWREERLRGRGGKVGKGKQVGRGVL